MSHVNRELQLVHEVLAMHGGSGGGSSLSSKEPHFAQKYGCGLDIGGDMEMGNGK